MKSSLITSIFLFRLICFSSNTVGVNNDPLNNKESVAQEPNKEHLNDHHEDEEETNLKEKISSANFWVFLTLSLFAIWLISLLGAIVPKKFVLKNNRKLIAFSIGSLVATIFFEILPHSLHNSHILISKNIAAADNIVKLCSSMVLIGILVGFIIETTVHLSSKGHIHGHRGCGDECEDMSKNSKMIIQARVDQINPVKSLKSEKRTVFKDLKEMEAFIFVDMIAKFFHHFIDGALIGSMYLVNVSAGFGVTASVAAHEISASLGAYSIYLSSGLSKRAAICVCSFGSISVIIGGFLVVLIEVYMESTNFLTFIPFIAFGLFNYLTLSDLLPLVMHEEHMTHSSLPKEVKNNKLRKTFKQKLIEALILLALFGVGFGLMFVILKFLGHSHDVNH